MALPKLDYQDLFRDPRMFHSRSTFVAAGFDVLRQAAAHNIMVGSHPTAPGYLFKKYSRDVDLRDQEENYRTRMRGADKIRHVIDRHRMRHLVVPRKWMYELPRAFGERRHASHVLVVEQMDILSVDETAACYRAIQPPMLDELCRVLFEFRGFDAAIHNLRFTADRQIAFIDTESWDRTPRDGTRVFRRIYEELQKDARRRVERTFERLYDDED